MAFGLSFGKKKSSGTTDVNKTESGTQTENQTKATTGTTTQSGTSNTSSSQTGSQTGTTTGQQTTQQVQTQFSDNILSQLEQSVGGLFNRIPSAADTTFNPGFDADAFVEGGMAAAESQVKDQLDESLNSMYDQFGGRDDSNSMAALLAARARSAAGAQMAGTHAELSGKANDIARANFEANLRGDASQQGWMQQLLGQLRGGRATTTGETQTAEQQAQQNATTGTQNTTSTSVQQQQLMETLASLMASTMNTVGTEKTKGKQSGGGASLSL